MDARAECRLRETIERHKAKRDSKEEARRGVRPDEWPLCVEYRDMNRGCGECPVKIARGGCHNTPYPALFQAWADWIAPACGDSWEEHDRNQAAAWWPYQKAEDAEIAFLESLLPEETA